MVISTANVPRFLNGCLDSGEPEQHPFAGALPAVNLQLLLANRLEACSAKLD